MVFIKNHLNFFFTVTRGSSIKLYLLVTERIHAFEITCIQDKLINKYINWQILFNIFNIQNIHSLPNQTTVQILGTQIQDTPTSHCCSTKAYHILHVGQKAEGTKLVARLPQCLFLLSIWSVLFLHSPVYQENSFIWWYFPHILEIAVVIWVSWAALALKFMLWLLSQLIRSTMSSMWASFNEKILKINTSLYNKGRKEDAILAKKHFLMLSNLMLWYLQTSFGKEIISLKNLLQVILLSIFGIYSWHTIKWNWIRYQISGSKSAVYIKLLNRAGRFTSNLKWEKVKLRLVLNKSTCNEH